MGVDLQGEWFDAMRRGEYPRAWSISDRLLAECEPGEGSTYLPRHQQSVWDGRSLRNRRVLVRCYHGLGDTIQFARFLPLLGRITSETVVWAQPALLGLLSTIPGSRRLLPLHHGAPEVAYDVDLEIMELSWALRAAPDRGAAVPYFDVAPEPRVSDRFSVGVLEQAGDWDTRRSIPSGLLMDRLQRGALWECFSLQLERRLPGIGDLSTPDILLLARRLRALDLVITPDTMLAHLAGALGVRVWTLLPAQADWRWLEPHRTDSPWYPSMRLFRQATPGEWLPVIDKVLAQLRDASRTRTAGRG